MVGHTSFVNGCDVMMKQLFHMVCGALQATIQIGDIIPSATFQYVPWTPELADNVSRWNILGSGE